MKRLFFIFLIIFYVSSHAHSENLTSSSNIIIEAEDYDQGGEGIAYHDNTSGNGGNTTLRQDEDVDLWDIGDGVIKIGSVQDGEWVNYTYNFPNTGNYKFTFFIGTPKSNADLHVFIDGNEVFTIDVPDTGSYSVFQEVTETYNVTEGERVITLKMFNDSFDIDKFSITSEGVDLSHLSEAFTYISTTDKKYTVSWDEESAAEYYIYRIYNLEKEIFINLENGKTEAKTETTSFIYKFPFSGHFIPSIKACRIKDDDDEECSEWSFSYDSNIATVDGEARAWWLYGYTKKPGGIVFE